MIDCNSALEWMRESFYVYPERGSIVWRNPPCRHPRLVGTEAGSPHPNSSGRFVARISVNKRHETIGVFDTANEASAAYQSKRREYFDEYA